MFVTIEEQLKVLITQLEKLKDIALAISNAYALNEIHSPMWYYHKGNSEHDIVTPWLNGDNLQLQPPCFAQLNALSLEERLLFIQEFCECYIMPSVCRAPTSFFALLCFERGR